MKDPATTTVVASAVAGSAAAFSVGEMLGVPSAALVAGLAGAVAITLFRRPKSTTIGLGYLAAIAAAVVGSVLVAGYLAPFTAAAIGMSTVDDSIEIKAHAFVWGAGAQVLLKTAIEAARKRIERLGGNE